MRRIRLMSLLVWMGAAAPGAAPVDPVVLIPQRPDPPIVVDGRLDDWATVPGALAINRPEQVVFQPEQLRSPDDNSATIRFCWRPAGLYLAAEVRDDVLINSGSGADAFRGDHLELYFDARPDAETWRDAFGEGQAHLLLSPGDLADDRLPGAFGRVNPEVFRAYPDDRSIPEASIAAAKTDAGWTLECFMPWEQLGVGEVRPGEALALEIALSDCDSSARRQEKMATLSSRPWVFRSRARLITASLADAAGSAVTPRTPAGPVVLLRDAVIAPRTQLTKVFDHTPRHDGSQPALFLRARLHSDQNDGDTFALHVLVNKQRIDGDRILNKPVEMPLLDGGSILIFSAGSFGFRIPYASTYDEANLSRAQGNPYARFDSHQPRTDFLIDLSGLLNEGANTLELVSSDPSVERDLHLEAELRQIAPRPKATVNREPVPAVQYVAPRSPAAELSWRESSDATLAVTVGKAAYQCRSYFSIPGGQWVHAGNEHFRHARTVRQEGGVIVVEDAFTNLDDQPLAILQRHEITAARTPRAFYLNGLKRPAKLPGYHQSFNATSFMGDDAAGIGVFPLDDVFRVHGENYIVGDDTVGLTDRALVLGPGASHVVRWAMAGAADGDYWSFINEARAFLGVNFTLTGPAAFMRMYPPFSDWPQEKIREQFLHRSASYGANAPDFHLVYQGKTLPYLCDHGQAAMNVDREIAGTEKWRRAVPDMKVIQYFACFIDSSDEAPARYAADAILDSAGKPTNYGAFYYPLFVPTLDNEFGRSMEQLLDKLLHEVRPDGIFWDEIAYSMVPYHYGPPWDGVSGDVDMASFEVRQLKSSVSLISRDWRVRQARRILAAGGTLIANGPVDAQDIRDMQVMAFTETGQASFCARTHLYTPIALGDHLSEVDEVDAYRGMLNALSHGCVYYWYSEDVQTTRTTLTEHMYPITPMRIGPGYLVGRERILTRTSGFFGWDDDSEFDVYVYDEQGASQSGDGVVDRVVVDERAWARVSLRPDWSAAIVRRGLHD